MRPPHLLSPSFDWALFAVVFSCFTILVGVSSAQELRNDFPRKKFIELGWDIPSTAYLKEHHEEMQRTTPFDGVMLSLETTAPDGKRQSSQSMMDAQPWDPAWFAQATDDLKACRWTTFTDNFIRVNFSPGTIDWEDDDGWRIFCNKTSLCAQLAKEVGLKGLAVDFESYGKAIFTYSADSGRSYDETKRIVRRCGRQWMEAIAAKYPEMTLFTLFIADVNLQAGYERRPADTLQSLPYGLLPAFFDGTLDAIPPKMLIVDGCESGYHKNGIDEFSRTALAIQSLGGPAIRLVSPENREKYIRRVQVGFGFYLDMYTNPEGNVYYRGPKEGATRLDRLEENLAAARETTDEYVWIYGEQNRWWKPDDSKTKWQHWEESLPGMSETIRFTKNPYDAASRTLETLRKESRAVNLLKNADFAESKLEKKQVGDQAVELAVPTEWTSWQHEPLGTFSWDDGGVKVSWVEWGCILQNFRPVKPGEYYYVAIDGKQRGIGQIGMRIRWQDAEGKWTRESEDRIFSFEKEPARLDGRPLPDGWSRAEGVVRIPDGVGVLQIQGEVKGQSNDGAARFDNAVLIRLR